MTLTQSVTCWEWRKHLSALKRKRQEVALFICEYQLIFLFLTQYNCIHRYRFQNYMYLVQQLTSKLMRWCPVACSEVLDFNVSFNTGQPDRFFMVSHILLREMCHSDFLPCLSQFIVHVTMAFDTANTLYMKNVVKLTRNEILKIIKHIFMVSS